MPNRRGWSDDDLRSAAATSTSFAMVLRKLGLSARGGSHYNVRTRVEALGIDISHFRGFGGSKHRPWTEEQLRAAVQASIRLGDVLQRLGVDRAEGMESKVRRDIRTLRLDTSHFAASSSRALRPRRWTDQQLIEAVVGSRSIAQVIQRLGLISAGGNYDQVQRRIRELALDTQHLTGSGWRRGASTPVRPPAPLSEVLVAGRWSGSQSLKERLFREGLKTAVCELCGWAQTRPIDGRIPVELDHINGDKSDNRIENLRILCQNCHALQPTHRGLNRRKRH